MLYQPPLPREYIELDQTQIIERIAKAKQQLGKDLVILGHHYQSDDVIGFADFIGDSLKLSQQAAATQAKYIIFCGVHFMAESADVLSGGKATVVLPHGLAGCSMAEMAPEDEISQALAEVSQVTSQRVIPITYVNSSAAAKAITARAGGACCTSSNVQNVFKWALSAAADGGAGAEKIFAIPDQHLGRNTAISLGYKESDCVVYDPKAPELGGLTAAQIKSAKFILWKGHCYVHQKFTPQQVRNVRKIYPGIKVIVHPECPHEVVSIADASGSTEQIIQAVAKGQPHSKWAIGTESNLVNRLAKRHTDMFIRTLSDMPSLCVQMARIDLPHLLYSIEGICRGLPANQVSVPPQIAQDARIALERMIAIKAVTGMTEK